MSTPVDKKLSIQVTVPGVGRASIAEALRHRIRAAGLLVVEQRTLLVYHEVGDDICWISPSDGFGLECDELTKDTVRRGFLEETGLRVDVSPLVYVREFAELATGRPHTELFYRIDTWRGESTLVNLKGLGSGKSDIREVGWITRDELPGLPSLYPAELVDDVQSRLDAPTPPIRHLGLQRQTLTTPNRQ